MSHLQLMILKGAPLSNIIAATLFALCLSKIFLLTAIRLIVRIKKIHKDLQPSKN